MVNETIQEQHDRDYELLLDIAEKIAPSWEKRRAEVEELAAPVRQWMLRELAPQEGDTLLELAAGVGDTGFEAAEIIGGGGRLITSDVSPAMLDASASPWCRARSLERRIPRGSMPRASRSTTMRSTVCSVGSATC